MSLVVTATLTFALPLAAPAIDCDAPDHTAAIQSMLAAGIAQTDPYDPLRFQRVPPVHVDLTECPVYRVSDTLHAFGGVMEGRPGTEIQWTGTSTGIVVHGPDTRTAQGTSRLFGLAGTPLEGFGASEPQVIRDLLLRSTSYSDTPTQRASAIVARRTIKLERTAVWGWSGDGVNIDCDVGRDHGWSECSFSTITDHTSRYTRGDALRTNGGDVNGMDIEEFKAWYYDGWCIHASGYLASTFASFACHGEASAKGAILSDSSNAKSRFWGYVEGYPLVDVAPPGVIVTMQGGTLSERTKMNGNFVTNPQFRPPLGGAEMLVWPGGEQGTIRTALAWSQGGDPDVLRLQHWPGRGWRLSWRNANSLTPWIVTDRTSTARPDGRLWLPQGYLGGAGAADVRWEACPPAADPASRPLASVVHCTNPVLGQALEWVVVTSSTSSARIWAPH